MAKNMEQLREEVLSKGVPISGLDDKQVRAVAKAFGLAPADQGHEVRIEKNDNGRTYVVTDAFSLGTDSKGKPVTGRGLYLAVGAIDQAIADLQEAKNLLASAQS